MLPLEAKHLEKVRVPKPKTEEHPPQILALEEFRQKKEKQVEPSDDEDDSTFAISKEIRSVQDLNKITIFRNIENWHNLQRLTNLF